MGILLTCGDFDIMWSYGNWSKFRMAIFHATIAYLQNKKENYIRNLQDDETQIRELAMISNLISRFDGCQNIDEINEVFDRMRKTIDEFIFFGVYGMYALTNKPDDNGFYSVGNSVDILDTIQLVENFVTDESAKERVSYAKQLFETSMNTKTIVNIM